MSGLTKKTTQYIFKNACKAFATLIELFGNDEHLELTETVEHFACNFYIYDLKGKNSLNKHILLLICVKRIFFVIFCYRKKMDIFCTW